MPVLKENKKLKVGGYFSCTFNTNLKIDKYPLPSIDESFKITRGLQYTKIDLSNAYKLTESSQRPTTIDTHKDLFSYTRLVSGLTNAPAIFQRAMDTLLSGLDDVCITGLTKEVSLAGLQEVFRRSQDYVYKKINALFSKTRLRT